MIEISVSGLTKSFEQEKKIIDHVQFQLSSGERVGLLGPNGAGKTTLFRLLTGEIDPDEGDIAVSTGRQIGLISQIPVYPAGYKVLDVLHSAFQRIDELAREMELVARQMETEATSTLLSDMMNCRRLLSGQEGMKQKSR